VVFALKKYRAYFLGRKFVLFTDHQALSQAFKKRDIHGRLARWLDLLAEYEIEIRYRSGLQNGPADLCSRIMPEDAADKEVVCVIAQDLEAELQSIASYLQGFQFDSLPGAAARTLVRRNSKAYAVIGGDLFRRTAKGFRTIPAPSDRSTIMHMFHDQIGHWSVKTTIQFITERFWWPNCFRQIANYVRTCDGCQRSGPIPKYRSTLHLPISGLFHTFSLDFAGPFPRTTLGNAWILVAVEHLSGWPVAQACQAATSEEVMSFVQQQIIESYGVPATILSDNAQCFHAKALRDFAAMRGISWKYVSPYAAQANGKVERFIGTMKRAMLRSLTATVTEWDKTIASILYGYRQRPQTDGWTPYQMLFGTPPRLAGVEPVALIENPTDNTRRIELLAQKVVQAARRTWEMPQVETKFAPGNKVLVARGAAMNLVKQAALVPKWYGPFEVTFADHPRYHLRAANGRVTRRPVHARRLRQYWDRTSNVAESEKQ
jgi:transposase InsO family protein